VRFEETLRGQLAAEPLHLSLPSSDAEMRIPGTGVGAQLSRPMAIAEAKANDLELDQGRRS
jgi:hypothetical protein